MSNKLPPGATLLRLQVRHTMSMDELLSEVPVEVVYAQPDGTEIVTDFVQAGTIIEPHHINDFRWRLP